MIRYDEGVNDPGGWDGPLGPPQIFIERHFTLNLLCLGMTRAEMILKVVMSPSDPPQIFIEQYVRLVQGRLVTLF